MLCSEGFQFFSEEVKLIFGEIALEIARGCLQSTFARGPPTGWCARGKAGNDSSRSMMDCKDAMIPQSLPQLIFV